MEILFFPQRGWCLCCLFEGFNLRNCLKINNRHLRYQIALSLFSVLSTVFFEVSSRRIAAIPILWIISQPYGCCFLGYSFLPPHFYALLFNPNLRVLESYHIHSGFNGFAFIENQLVASLLFFPVPFYCLLISLLSSHSKIPINWHLQPASPLLFVFITCRFLTHLHLTYLHASLPYSDCD